MVLFLASDERRALALTFRRISQSNFIGIIRGRNLKNAFLVINLKYVMARVNGLFVILS